MRSINVHDAKTNLSKLLKRVEAGEEVVIARAGKPIARILPIQDTSKQRSPGSAIGMITINDSFFDPLPNDVLKDFEG
jgi:prevent-host-death family protein